MKEKVPTEAFHIETAPISNKGASLIEVNFKETDAIICTKEVADQLLSHHFKDAPPIPVVVVPSRHLDDSVRIFKDMKFRKMHAVVEAAKFILCGHERLDVPYLCMPTHDYRQLKKAIEELEAE